MAFRFADNLDRNLTALAAGCDIQTIEDYLKAGGETWQKFFEWDLTAPLVLDMEGTGETELTSGVAKDGRPFLICSTGGRPLHSKRDPYRENFKVPPGNVVVLLGAGLGYNLLSYNFERPVVLLEPHLGLLVLLLSHIDFSERIAAGELRIFWQNENEDAVYKRIRNLGSLQFSFIPHRATLQALGTGGYYALRDRVWEIVEKKAVNLNTLSRFEKVWTRNIGRNARYYTGAGDDLAVLKQKCSSYQSAVLVCAGPSLTRQNEPALVALKEARRQNKSILVVAVDTSLHPLKAYGIKPDIVFSVDPQSISRYYLEASGDIPLVAEPSCDPYSLQFHKGSKYFAASSFPLFKIFNNNELTKLAFGGSVSTNALDFLLQTSIPKLYMLGQDLAYVNKLAHTRGAKVEGRIQTFCTRTATFETHNYRQLTSVPVYLEPAYDGGKQPTNDKLLIFRDWIAKHYQENKSKNCELKVIGLAGLKIEGVAAVPAEDFAAGLSKLPEKPPAETKPAEAKQLPPASAILDVLVELAAFLRKVEAGLKLAVEIKDILEHTPAYVEKNPDAWNKKLTDMDGYDESISGKKGLSELVSLSIQRIIFQITEGYGETAEGSDKRVAIAGKSVALYKGIRDGIQSTRRSLWRGLMTM